MEHTTICTANNDEFFFTLSAFTPNIIGVTVTYSVTTFARNERMKILNTIAYSNIFDAMQAFRYLGKDGKVFY